MKPFSFSLRLTLASHSYVDVLENEMGAEVENGRIVRLLTKLGFINERAEWVSSFDRWIPRVKGN